MRQLILVALLLSGCVTNQPATIKPTPELVARQFEAAAFGNDFGPGSLILLRWEVPIRFHLVAFEKVIDSMFYSDVLMQFRSDLRDVFYWPFSHMHEREDANVIIALLKRERFSELIDTLPTKPPYSNKLANTTACFGVLYRDPESGRIDRALVGVATNISDKLKRECIPEEIFQSLGLPGDACHYRPSLICEFDRYSGIQAADKLMLDVLYDSSLTTGMTKEEAMPIVRRLIKERWDKYMVNQ